LKIPVPAEVTIKAVVTPLAVLDPVSEYVIVYMPTGNPRDVDERVTSETFPVHTDVAEVPVRL
jgi:hypothetical protein